MRSLLSLSRAERVIALILFLGCLLFGSIAYQAKNHEFILYIGVIVVFFLVTLLNQARVKFSIGILVGLTIWAFFHMAGGLVHVGTGVLYGWVLFPLWPEQQILKFDQFVHAWGFGVTTIVCHHLLSRRLGKQPLDSTLLILICLMGVGAGALNEIVEFVAVLSFPETGVGGYSNTLWDLVFNLIGCIGALVLLKLKEVKIQ